MLVTSLSQEKHDETTRNSEERSPFTTAEKLFEKNYILNGYYICVHYEGTICENLSLFLYLYADFFIE